MSSNFSKLIDRIASERRSRSNAVPNIIQLQKSSAANKMHCKSMIKSMQQMKRDLAPTKDELKTANRLKMDRYKASLKKAVMSKSLTTIDVAKLESAAYRISTQLASRGLI